VNGQVVIGGDANNGTAEGLQLNSSGFIQISRGSGVSALWAGYTEGSSTQTSRINNNGNAHFLGNLGVGTASPSDKLSLSGTGTILSVASGPVLALADTSGRTLKIAGPGTTANAVIGTTTNHNLDFITGNTVRATVDSSGRLLVGTSSEVSDSSHAKIQAASTGGASLALGRDDASVTSGNDIGLIRFYGNDGGSYQECARISTQADGSHSNTSKPSRLVFSTTASSATSPTERMRIDSSGNVGIGTSSPDGLLHCASTTTLAGAVLSTTAGSDAEIEFRNTNGGNATWAAGLDFSNSKSFNLAYAAAEGASLSANSLLTVTTGGKVGIGTSSPLSGAQLTVAGLCVAITGQNTDHGANSLRLGEEGSGLAQFRAYGPDTSTSGSFQFDCSSSNGTGTGETMRIHNDGTIGMAMGSFTDKSVALNSGNGGFVVTPQGGAEVAENNGTAFKVNRIGNDGNLVVFYQAGTAEGSINVSGTTVSYNGGHLARWSQLPGGAERTEILRGSVLSNLDEMCEWGEEDNEQLNRMKVSDTEGDKNVSGVFQAWDDDDDTYTNDFYCAMTGDFVIRIAQGTTVDRGDLLMSAGDGTAKPQDDDIVRSKTIAKVTSTTVSETYSDGSYCVPCVLMAC